MRQRLGLTVLPSIGREIFHIHIVNDRATNRQSFYRLTLGRVPDCPPCFPPLLFGKADFLPYPSEDGGLWLLLLFLFNRSVSSLTFDSNWAILASFNIITDRREAFSSSSSLTRNSRDANLSSMVNIGMIMNTFLFLYYLSFMVGSK